MVCLTCSSPAHLFRFTTGSGGTSWQRWYCWPCRKALGVDSYHASECSCDMN